MNRHALVAAASSAVIAGSVAYALLGAAALDSVQFKWAGESGFGYMSMINGGYVEVCNPSPLPVLLDRLEISAAHQGRDFASFSAEGGVIGPGEAGVLLGEGESLGAGVNVLSMYVDSEAGGADLRGFDSGEAGASSTLSTLVFGAIPHSVTREYSVDEFFGMMEGELDYGC